MRPWVQLELQSDPASGGLRVQISDASGGMRTTGQIVPGITPEEIQRFERSVVRLAQRGRPLASTHEQWARQLYTRLIDGDRARIVDQLRGPSGQLLVRLSISDPDLRGVPWEVMRGPADTDPSLAVSGRMQVVRGVFSSRPAVPREVRGAMRLLAVAPESMRFAVADLEASLQTAVHAGLVEWLPPCIGEDARWPALLARLQRSPRPHAVHIIAHGRVRDGQAALLLEPGTDTWLPVDLMGSALAEHVGDELRLVYLESCSGAEPGPLASAAEHLATQGPMGVVAHLWSVGAAEARSLARTFYDALTGSAEGDVAAALATARLGMAGTGSVEFLCPVLYLRGADPRLFDFTRRRVRPPQTPQGGPSEQMTETQQRAVDRLHALLSGPCSVVIGDQLGTKAGDLLGNERLRAALAHHLDDAGDSPLTHLMQRVEMLFEREELSMLVQEIMDPLTRDGQTPSHLVDGFARLACPGLLVTLLWVPLLEETIALRNPELPLVVLQPRRPGGLERMWVFRRDPGEAGWRRVSALPERFDLENELVMVRLHGGYSPLTRSLVGEPVLTDDDRLAHLSVLDLLPRQLLAHLRHHPVATVGLCPLQWAHREILRRLTGNQPLAPGSIAVVGPEASEEEERFWSRGSWPAGRSGGVTAVPYEVLSGALRRLA